MKFSHRVFHRSTFVSILVCWAVVGLVGCIVSKPATASNTFEVGKMADKVTDKITSASLAAEVEKLPEVEIDSAWEADPIKFKSEIENVLKQKSLPVDRPFKRTIWFNQPSKVTGKAKYTTLVISLALRKSVRLQGDDVFLALQQKKEFSKDEIEILKEVFLRNR